jgi:hypothetical protein
LAWQLGDQLQHHDTGQDKNTSAKDDTGQDKTKTDSGTGKDGTDKNGETKTLPTEDQKPAAAPPLPTPAPTVPASGAPPGGPALPPPTTVALPDGSTVSAATPVVAQAVKSYLSGTPLEVAYRQAGIELPPPGTPVTAPIDPSQLAAGDVGMFKDHYVAALGTGKVVQDGQVAPLSALTSSPDFLGWIRPSAPARSDPVTAAPGPAPSS